MTLALALLLCMFLGTHGFNKQHPIEPQPNFDLEKFSGEWYRIGLADESELFARFKNQLRVSKGLLVPNGNGNVTLTMWTLRPYGCSVSVYSYEKTDVPGEFTYFSKRHKITKDITILETNYTDYSLVLKYKNMDKEYTQVALYGRSSILRPDLIEKFRSVALSLGFSEEAIVAPTDIDPCPILEPRNTAEFREDKSAQTVNQSVFATENLSKVQPWSQTLGNMYSVLLHIWGTVFALTLTIIGEMQHYNVNVTQLVLQL